jgi:hypothetical protein
MNFEKPPKFVRVTTDIKSGKIMDYRMRRTLPTKLDFHFFTQGSWHMLDSQNLLPRQKIDELIQRAKLSLNPNHNRVRVSKGPYWVVTDSTGTVVNDWQSHAQKQ